jgi:acetaldehyde dehydrogenase (acetylating)
MDKVKVAIIGSGNIGTDLMYKISRSKLLELTAVIGIIPESEGLMLARQNGFVGTADGIDFLARNPQMADIVFDATTAKAHLRHAPILKELGKVAIDLTPAAIGPYVVPSVNLGEHLEARNVNMVTCGGQATIPVVAAISRVTKVKYAEIVATIASKSAGPGTRQNIDEFTQTTREGLVKVAKAPRAKALIILNPAEPPILMRDTIYVQADEFCEEAVNKAIEETVAGIKDYVPGYRLRTAPIFDKDWVTVLVEVEGAGDYLPKYAGNLDIMTSAAVRVGEEIASAMIGANGKGGESR